MTPKEKAKEIFNKFYGIPLYLKTVKECCHITANEVIAHLPENYSVVSSKGSVDANRSLSYWLDVIKEIEKL